MDAVDATVNSRRWRVTLGASILAMGLVAGAGVLITRSVARATPLAPVGHVLAVYTKESSRSSETLLSRVTPIRGTRTVVTIPPGITARIDVRLSGSDNCTPVSTSASVQCLVRANLNQKDIVHPGPVVFDSNPKASGPKGTLRAHSMEWTSAPRHPGTYVVRLQWRLASTPGIYTLGPWDLMVQVIQSTR